MKTGKIEITLGEIEMHIPESIVFSSTFLLTNPILIDEKLKELETSFLEFLDTNNLKFTGPHMRRMDNDGNEYKFPAYDIHLSHSDYLKLEKYRDKNPELSGIVGQSVFSKESKRHLLNNLSKVAYKQAMEVAEKEKLELKPQYEIEELSLPLSKWQLSPPLSARYNHFLQPLEAKFKFIFTVE